LRHAIVTCFQQAETFGSVEPGTRGIERGDRISGQALVV